jgi:hypothetical protein
VLKQVEILHPGHSQIEHKTTGVRPMSGLQELVRRGERLHVEADPRQKIPDGRRSEASPDEAKGATEGFARMRNVGPPDPFAFLRKTG